jgi:hypothetical protein
MLAYDLVNPRRSLCATIDTITGYMMKDDDFQLDLMLYLQECNGRPVHPWAKDI